MSARKTGTVRRFLVHDEVEDIVGRHGTTSRFRCRIWRGHSYPHDLLGMNGNPSEMVPVVLVSDASGGQSGFVCPTIYRTKIANYVKEAYLAHGGMGMMYFDYAISNLNEHCVTLALSQVLFEYFGHKHRLRLFRPIDNPVCMVWFEDLLGTGIDW